jgi:hypothetical protein
MFNNNQRAQNLSRDSCLVDKHLAFIKFGLHSFDPIMRNAHASDVSAQTLFSLLILHVGHAGNELKWLVYWQCLKLIVWYQTYLAVAFERECN